MVGRDEDYVVVAVGHSEAGPDHFWIARLRPTTSSHELEPLFWCNSGAFVPTNVYQQGIAERFYVCKYVRYYGTVT